MKELNAIVENIDEKSRSILQSPGVLKIILGEYSVRELMKIYPSKLFIKVFLNLAVKPLRTCLHGLSDNVSFLTIEVADLLRVSCDWCSLCNGIFETAKQNLIHDPSQWNTIDEKDLYVLNNFLDFILDERKIKIMDEDVNEFHNQNFSETPLNMKQRYFSMCYLKFESIELRWCPFKRSKEFYYRNKDHRFINPTKENIKTVGLILMQNETITCNNCPDLLNKNQNAFIPDYQNTSIEANIFAPLLEYIESGKPFQDSNRLDPNDNMLLQMVSKYSAQPMA